MSTLTDHTADLHRLAGRVADPSALDELLARVLVALARVVPYDLAAVYELAGDELTVRAAAGRLADDRLRRRRRSLRAFPTIRHALDERRPHALDAADDPHADLLDLPPDHACLLVPLFAPDRDLGVIVVDRATGGAFTEDAIELAAIHGQLASMAMMLADQAALLERYRRRLDEDDRLRAGAPTTTAPVDDTEPVVTFQEYERRYLRRILDRTRGKIYGPGGAAALLGMPPTTLQSRLRRLGLR